MSNIVKIGQSELCPNLNVIERQIVLSAAESQIRSLPRKDVLLAVNEAITKALFVLGNTKSLKSDQDKFMAVELISDDLIQNYGFLTLSDIKILSHKGSLGEFTTEGGITMVSVASYYNWAKSFVVMRQLAVKKQNDHLRLLEIQNQVPLDLSEAKSRMDKYAFGAFEEYKKTGKYHDIANTIYEHINKYTEMPFTPERKKQIYEQAKEKLLKDNDPDLSVSPKDRKDRIKNYYEISESKDYTCEKVKIEAKRITLNLYFDYLIETETELTEILTKK